MEQDYYPFIDTTIIQMGHPVLSGCGVLSLIHFLFPRTIGAQLFLFIKNKITVPIKLIVQSILKSSKIFAFVRMNALQQFP